MHTLVRRFAPAAALLVAAPSAAHATGSYSTYTNRSQYLAALNAGNLQSRSLSAGVVSALPGSPATFDGIQVSVTNGVAADDGMGGLDLIAGSNGSATFTFTLPSGTRGFGFDLTQVISLAGPRNADPMPDAPFTLDATFGTNYGGIPLTYRLSGPALPYPTSDTFFGVVTNGDGYFTQFTGVQTTVATVTVTEQQPYTFGNASDFVIASNTVPEPSSVALVGTGLAAGAAAVRRRRRPA